mmetsp:Transcript_31326/g.105469  ORF Transcript_31326/g.105469 Transcript_31326/m.105469 type:complete len:248 (-) Transcript_31326:304-1047(-)
MNKGPAQCCCAANRRHQPRFESKTVKAREARQMRIRVWTRKAAGSKAPSSRNSEHTQSLLQFFASKPHSHSAANANAPGASALTSRWSCWSCVDLRSRCRFSTMTVSRVRSWPLWQSFAHQAQTEATSHVTQYKGSEMGLNDAGDPAAGNLLEAGIERAHVHLCFTTTSADDLGRPTWAFGLFATGFPSTAFVPTATCLRAKARVWQSPAATFRNCAFLGSVTTSVGAILHRLSPRPSSPFQPLPQA